MRLIPGATRRSRSKPSGSPYVLIPSWGLDDVTLDVKLFYGSIKHTCRFKLFVTLSGTVKRILFQLVDTRTNR